jgi:hypothetical protein
MPVDDDRVATPQLARGVVLLSRTAADVNLAGFDRCFVREFDARRRLQGASQRGKRQQKQEWAHNNVVPEWESVAEWRGLEIWVA